MIDIKSCKHLFNPHIRKRFRNKYLGGPEGLTFAYYYSHPSNNKGRVEIKALWNKICSSMDWIDVASIGLYNSDKLLKLLKQNRGLKNSVLLYNLISNISLLNNAVKSIWAGFEAGENRFNYRLFNGDSHIFNGSALKNRFTQQDILSHETYVHVDDNIYFSRIRAFFGTHATDGNTKIFVDFKGIQHKIRFFSSYSTKGLIDDTKMIYDVNMYCNNHFIDNHMLNLRINVYNLIKFAYVRYRSLIKLSRFIKGFFHKIRMNIRNKVLKVNKNDSLLVRLVKLNKFAKDTRFMSVYYDDEIKCYIHMLRIFNSPSECTRFTRNDWHKINYYIIHVVKGHVIKTYFNALNNATFYRSKYIESIDNIEPKWARNSDISYDYEKVMSTGGSQLEGYPQIPFIYSISLSRLIEYNKLPKYAMTLKPDEVYLLIISRSFYRDPKMSNSVPVVGRNSSKSFGNLIKMLRKYVNKNENK